MVSPRADLPRRAARRLTHEVVKLFELARVAPESALAWARNQRGQRRYRVLNEHQIRATRTSDTAFVFGCGYSINDITPQEWAGIARHNTIGFNDFVKQTFVRVDYHVVGEIFYLDPTTERMRASPFYRNTVYVLQGGFRGYRGNDIVGRGLLPPGSRIFRYRRVARGRMVPPSRSPRVLVHGMGSVMGVTNFAYAMGYRRIVLCGIDLYDRRYFWLRPDETLPYDRPGLTWQSKFLGADDLVKGFELWRGLLEDEGVELLVLNARSLLAQVMPVYERRELVR